MIFTHRILITGAAGYIGRFVCQELARQGFLPIAFDDFAHGRTPPTGACAVEQGVMTEESLSAVMGRYLPVGVIHLAGGRGGRHSNPKFTFDNEDGSVSETTILLAVMAKYNVRHIVFASSAAVYGDLGSVRATETSPLRATSTYGKAKIASEIRIRAWGENAHRGWIILRYANAVGADPASMLGSASRKRLKAPLER